MDANALIAQFGVAGVIIAGLIWDRVRILKDNDALQKEVRDLYKDNAETLKQVASSLHTFADTQKAEK